MLSHCRARVTRNSKGAADRQSRTGWLAFVKVDYVRFCSSASLTLVSLPRVKAVRLLPPFLPFYAPEGHYSLNELRRSREYLHPSLPSPSFVRFLSARTLFETFPPANTPTGERDFSNDEHRHATLQSPLGSPIPLAAQRRGEKKLRRPKETSRLLELDYQEEKKKKKKKKENSSFNIEPQKRAEIDRYEIIGDQAFPISGRKEWKKRRDRESNA